MSQTRTMTINPPIKKKIVSTESQNEVSTETEVQLPKKTYLKMQNNLISTNKQNDELAVENELLKKDADQKVSHCSGLLKKERDRVKILEEKIKYYEEKKNKTINVKDDNLNVEDVEKRKQYRQEMYLKKMKEQEKAFEEWKKINQ